MKNKSRGLKPLNILKLIFFSCEKYVIGVLFFQSFLRNGFTYYWHICSKKTPCYTCSLRLCSSITHPFLSLSVTLLLFLQTSIIQGTCSMFSLSHCCHHCELVTNNRSVKYYIFTVESTFGRWIQELVIILIYLRQVITLLPIKIDNVCKETTYANDSSINVNPPILNVNDHDQYCEWLKRYQMNNISSLTLTFGKLT